MSNPINTKTFVKLLVDNTLQLIEERDGYIRFNFFNMTAVEWKNWSSVLNLTSTSEAVRFIYNNEPPLVDNEFPNLANSHSNVGAQMLSLVFKKTQLPAPHFTGIIEISMPENSEIENNFNRLCERMNIDPSNTVKDKLVLIPIFILF